MENLLASFWQSFIEIHPQYKGLRRPIAWSFGDSPAMAERLGKLVLEGKKTATCGALAFYDIDHEPLPTAGDLDIILDGENRPWFIIENTEVIIQSYSEVDAQFAFDEGEGDQTLEDWRRAHWNYFSRTLPKMGLEPRLDMQVVCQRFRKIYP